MLNATNNIKNDPFKFQLQEDKLSAINNSNKNTKRKNENDDKQNLSMSKKFEDSGDYNSMAKDFQSNNYLKKLMDYYKEEISTLKGYIIRINNELIKNNITLNTPNIIKPDGENFDDYDKFINEACKKLLNYKYLNPLFEMYDSHITNIEKELKNTKHLASKYENTIKELLNENCMLRENLEVKNLELKGLFEKKIKINDQLVYEEEYIIKLEERSNMLSRENEILLNNLQKISQKLFEFQLNYSEKYTESIEKINVVDKINLGYEDLKIKYDQSLIKIQIAESKINELIEKNAKLELCCENLVSENHNLRSDNKYLEGTLNIFRNNKKFDI